jgi:predicted nucleic acid-binding protein
MSALKLVDTNIIVYAFDSSDKKKHKLAMELLDDCFERKVQFYLSTQNISEFYNVVTRFVDNPVPKSEAMNICKKIIGFSGFIKLVPTPSAMIRAMDIDKEYGSGYWDALIAATMLDNGVGIIITENTRDFMKIPGISIENPFG